MLLYDIRKIGNKLLECRKMTGLTQAELAEKAGLADRTYADIERGNAPPQLFLTYTTAMSARSAMNRFL